MLHGPKFYGKKLGREEDRKHWEVESLNRMIGESFSINITFESTSERDERITGGKYSRLGIVPKSAASRLHGPDRLEQTE